MSVSVRDAALQPSSATTQARPLGSLLLGIVTAGNLLPLEASFYLGTLRLTPGRLTLIVLAPYVLSKMLGPDYRFVVSDIFFPLTALWMILANSVMQGADHAAISTGIVALEMCLPYFLARVCVHTESDVIAAISYYGLGVGLIGVLAILDPLFDRYVIHEIFGSFTGYSSGYLLRDYRFGLLRASGTLEHPILLGTNCTVAILLSFCLLGWKRWWVRGCSLVGLILSFSSGPLGGLALGLALMAYNRMFIGLRARWSIAFSGALVLGSIIYFSANDPLGRFLSTFTFDAQSAYYRLSIWHYGILNIANSPVFGIGLDAPWVREDWMTGSSVDAFWLLTTMTYGLPGLLLTILCWIVPIFSKLQPTNDNATTINFQLVLNITLVSIIYIGFTVDFWGPTVITTSLLLGLRAGLGALKQERLSTEIPGSGRGDPSPLRAVTQVEPPGLHTASRR